MKKYKLYELSYSSNYLSYCSNFRSLPGFVHLLSGNLFKSRYDIISAWPYQQIYSHIDTIYNKLFDDLIRGFCLNTRYSDLELPFQGGAIGYFSYDLGCEWAKVPVKEFEPYKALPRGYLGLYDWAIIVDHHLQKVWLFAANKHPQTEALLPQIKNLWRANEVQDEFAVSRFTPLMSKNQYKEAFVKIQNDLLAGRCYQVNLTQLFRAEYQGDSYQLFQKVAQQNPVPYAAYISLTNSAMLSFSPEQFLTAENAKVVTSPIKGTAAASSDKALDEAIREQLANCSKNKAENVMIVDLLRNDLGKFALPGSVKVEQLYQVETFRGVHHLVSKVIASYPKDTSVFDLLTACFPGGSITGAPKLEAMRVISELEPHPRGPYCGVIGYYSNHGRFDSNIAIRTIIATDKLYLAAGGGIVIDSNWQSEYDECFIKIAPIINGLNNARSRGYCPC